MLGRTSGPYGEDLERGVADRTPESQAPAPPDQRAEGQQRGAGDGRGRVRGGAGCTEPGWRRMTVAFHRP